MKYEIYALTHPGHVRTNNEDFFSIPNVSPVECGLAVVADGMGGHNAGEIASKLAVETFVKSFYDDNDGSTQYATDKLSNAVRKANEAVYSKAQTEAELNNMGTTLTACYVDNSGKAVFINVGDSRAYLIHAGEAYQVSHDHSVVQDLIDKELISPNQADSHPQKNIITRAIGIDSAVVGDTFVRGLIDGDYILLCSDGLTEHVPVDKLGLLFDSTCTVQSISSTLLDLALAKGGHDNITVAVIRCING